MSNLRCHSIRLITVWLCGAAVAATVISGCVAGGRYKQFFRVEPRVFPSSNGDSLFLRSKTYALAANSSSDTIDLQMDENYASLFVVALTSATTIGSQGVIPAPAIGLVTVVPTDKGINHPYHDQPLWFRLELCWGDTAADTPPSVTIEADSIVLNYLDEHRIRPFGWIDRNVYTDRGEKRISLGPFPLERVKVKDIIDARKVRDLPRYRLTFDALIKNESGGLIERRRIESSMTFARKKLHPLDSTELAID